MQKNTTSLQTSISRKAAWLLMLYAFCCFHHELVDAAHFLGHLFEHHHHVHGHHHHAAYHEQTSTPSHATLHKHEPSDHSHPILALFDWDDEQGDPENTNSSSTETRKQIDQHIGVMLTMAQQPLADPYSRRYFLVKIIRSLDHASISSPPPEQWV